jgi:hypothetical protein
VSKRSLKTGASARDDPSWAVCEVIWRRGHVLGSFVAVAENGSRHEIARSPRFRWRDGSTPQELPTIADCLRALDDRLATDGWERIDEGSGAWWARRYRRRLAPRLTGRPGGRAPGNGDGVPARVRPRASRAKRDVQSQPAHPDSTPQTAFPAAGEPKPPSRHGETIGLLEPEDDAIGADQLEAAPGNEPASRTADEREVEHGETDRLDPAERGAAGPGSEDREGAPPYAGSSLDERLNAYSAKGAPEMEIRALFDRKRVARREHRVTR